VTVHQVLLDPGDGGQHPGIVVVHEAGVGYLEQRGIHLGVVVGLGEGADLVVPAPLVDLVMQPLPKLVPTPDVTVEPVPLDRLHTPVERRPHHDPAVREVVRSAAHLPDAVVLSVQVLLAVAQYLLLQAPGVGVLYHAGVAEIRQGDHHLPGYVGLVLLGRGVADADRLGPLVAGQVV